MTEPADPDRPVEPDYARLFRLDGRRAVVVGAGSGIGQAAARALAAHGADVVCADLDPVAAGDTAGSGEGMRAYELDVLDRDAVRVAAADLGEVDVLVFTTGRNVRKRLLDYGEDEFDQVIALNLRASFDLIRAFGAGMALRGRGSIIATASIRALVVEPGQGVYAATKAGLVQLVRTAAAELGSSGVRVNALAPGVVETPLTAPIAAVPEWYDAYARKTALGRWAQPSELAGAVVFLASDAASYVTGSVLFVDGGWTAIDGRYDPPAEAGQDGGMAELVLGPLLRYVDYTSATVWVETDRPCVVRVLGSEVKTFSIHGHHYALVDVTGLASGSSTPYEVHLDGERCWPDPSLSLPPSRIRTLDSNRPVRLVFGSCRTAVPHDKEHNATHGLDTLVAFGHRLARAPEESWPDAILFLGDQVYADEPSEEMTSFIEAKRGLDQPPGAELADFEEYAKVYQLAWSDPANRWLLSTIPSMMIFDDHDIRDDWNTSVQWREQMASLTWWHDRIIGGLGSYWVYQHAGNLSIADRATDPLYAAIVATDGDAGAVLDEFADLADKEPERNRWSYSRELGRTRLVVLDSRCGRVLRPGVRKVLDDAEWGWFDALAQGGIDHLLIGTSLPYLLPRGLHELEYWNEEVGDGRWGSRAARLAERIRQGIDLEHWAAFHDSFDLMAETITELSAGERGPAPASIVFLSGDVHYSYLMRAETRAGQPPDERSQRSAIFQATCSPIRNPLARVLRYGNTVASFGIAGVAGRLLARCAGLREQALRWKLVVGPKFDNALATLDLDGRRATVRWETAKLDSGEKIPDVVEIATAELV